MISLLIEEYLILNTASPKKGPISQPAPKNAIVLRPVVRIGSRPRLALNAVS
jgi:hypothetical protein